MGGLQYSDIEGIAVYEAKPRTYMNQYLGCWNDKSSSRTMDNRGPIYVTSDNSFDAVKDCSNTSISKTSKYFSVQNYSEPGHNQISFQCWYGDNIGTAGLLDNPGEQGYQMYGPAECKQSLTGEDVGMDLVNAVYRGGHLD